MPAPRGIELNVYYIPTEMYRTGVQVEQQYLDVAQGREGRRHDSGSDQGGPVLQLVRAHGRPAGRGRRRRARALQPVLPARFRHRDARRSCPSLSLSKPEEMRLPLLWIALLYGRVKASLAATTGVHGPVEAIKYLMAGADVVMSTSALLQQGPPFLSRLVADVSGWMEKKGYASVSQMRGSMSQQAIPDSTAFVRGNYIRVLESYKGGTY